MAHEICNNLDRKEGRVKQTCDSKCKYYQFDHLDIACVLSEVFSVKKGDGCYIKEPIDKGE